MLSLYPAFEDSFSQLEELLSIYPEGFLEAFGLGEGGLDMSSPYGWFGTEGYLFVVLIGGSYAAILGSSIISKEEDDKTIEFLLSKPLSRNQVLLGKGLVVLINILLLNIAMFIGLLITFALVADLQLLTTILLCVGPLILELIFASIAMAISVFVTKSRQVMSISLGLVIGLYVLNIVATLTDELNFLIYATPYEYVNAVDIVNENLIEPLYLLISFGIVLISGLVTWFFYNRKDITV
jgi:ABC-2 type transport system permease protein